MLQTEKILNKRFTLEAECRVGEVSICQMGGEVLLLEELGQDLKEGVLAVEKLALQGTSGVKCN